MRYNNLKYFVMVIGLIFLVSCGGGGSGAGGGGATTSGVTGTSTVTSGQTNVLLDASITYTLSGAIDPTTVTANTIFIVPGAAAGDESGLKAYDSSVCNAANKVSGFEVTVGSDNKTITVTLSENLEQCKGYYLCITTEIKDADGNSFQGDTISFDSICCSTLYAGPGCTFDGFNVDSSTTFTYEQIVTVAEGDAGVPESAPYCACAAAYNAGSTGCIPIGDEEQIRSCGFGGGEEGGGESLNCNSTYYAGSNCDEITDQSVCEAAYGYDIDNNYKNCEWSNGSCGVGAACLYNYLTCHGDPVDNGCIGLDVGNCDKFYFDNNGVF